MDKPSEKDKRVVAIAACHDGCEGFDVVDLQEKIEIALKGRGNVVMTRLNNEDLEKLDALVEIELFKSRSEAAAFFIAEGIRSKEDLFHQVMPTMEKIKNLKEELKSALK